MIRSPMSERVPRARPLSPSTFLLRNTGKTVPLMLVIILSVMLVAGIISMINSITLSIRTIYRYSKNFVALTPRGDPSLTPRVREELEAGTPVKLDRVMVCRGSELMVKSIVGKWPFGCIALGQDDMRYYVRRLGGEKIVGRYPAAGAAEAIVSEPVARNLGLKLGSPVMGPTNDDAYSPYAVKLVGIAQTDEWLVVAPIEYHRANHFPPVDLLIAFARTESDQRALDTWCLLNFKGDRTKVFAYSQLDRDTNKMFSILYKVLNVVIGTLVVVITFMMGMLMNIYQAQRLQEFGLLQALGYTRASLLARVLREAVLVVIGGWILGVMCAIGMLKVVEQTLMYPQAFALDPFDRVAYLYTLPIPVAIMGAAFVTVWLRFRQFDPVGIVERRLV